jgi:perosamine synthetase
MKRICLDCLDTTWFLQWKIYWAFWQAFARFCDAKHAIACFNGTVALHLALLC